MTKAMHIQIAQAEAARMTTAEVFAAMQLWTNRYAEVQNELTAGLMMVFGNEFRARMAAK